MSEKPEDSIPALDELLRNLGYVMLHWSMVERAVLDDIKRLRSGDGDSGQLSIRARGSFSERLAEWCALVRLKSRRDAALAGEVAEIASEAQRLRRTCDLLAHHFTGVEEGEQAEWQVLVSEHGISSMRASQTAFTTTQLGDLIEEMKGVRLRIRQLQDASPT